MEQTHYDEQGSYSLFCHSMGCYFATHWAKKHFAKIEQCFFMSPCGLFGKPSNFSPTDWINSYESRAKRSLFTVAHWFWGAHLSPSIAFKLPGYYGALLLHRGWMQRIKNRDPTVRSCYSKLLMQTGLRKTSFDTCLDVLIAFGGHPYRPLSDLISQHTEL